MAQRASKDMLIIVDDMFFRASVVHDIAVTPRSAGLIFKKTKWKVVTQYDNIHGERTVALSDDFDSQEEALKYKDKILEQVKHQTEGL